MQIIKRNQFLAGVLFGIAIIAASPFVDAASSFTYGVVLQLIGNNIQPTQTSQSYTTQIQSPSITAASSTGTLTGGKIAIKVAGLTSSGTSSPSNEIATTTSINEALRITWPSIPGATGYVVYVGTSTPGSEQSYFMATSTAGVVNTQYTLMTTTSPTYYTIPNQGTGFYTSMNSATTTFDTTGLIRAQSSATTTCTAALNGAMFYNPSNAHLWLCTGAGPAWTLIK